MRQLALVLHHAFFGGILLQRVVHAYFGSGKNLKLHIADHVKVLQCKAACSCDMCTPLVTQNAGIAFVGVHDSFWTHPGDVPVLNRVLREAFVDLHSRPLLEQLREELISRNPDVDPSAFPPIPSVGDLDLQEVLKSDYFFN